MFNIIYDLYSKKRDEEEKNFRYYISYLFFILISIDVMLTLFNLITNYNNDFSNPLKFITMNRCNIFLLLLFTVFFVFFRIGDNRILSDEDRRVILEEIIVSFKVENEVIYRNLLIKSRCITKTNKYIFFCIPIVIFLIVCAISCYNTFFTNTNSYNFLIFSIRSISIVILICVLLALFFRSKRNDFCRLIIKSYNLDIDSENNSYDFNSNDLLLFLHKSKEELKETKYYIYIHRNFLDLKEGIKVFELGFTSVTVAVFILLFGRILEGDSTKFVLYVFIYAGIVCLIQLWRYYVYELKLIEYGVFEDVLSMVPNDLKLDITTQKGRREKLKKKYPMSRRM